jgi:hypothetical protein
VRHLRDPSIPRHNTGDDESLEPDIEQGGAMEHRDAGRLALPDLAPHNFSEMPRSQTSSGLLCRAFSRLPLAFDFWFLAGVNRRRFANLLARKASSQVSLLHRQRIRPLNGVIVFLPNATQTAQAMLWPRTLSIIPARKGAVARDWHCAAGTGASPCTPLTINSRPVLIKTT